MHTSVRRKQSEVGSKQTQTEPASVATPMLAPIVRPAERGLMAHAGPAVRLSAPHQGGVVQLQLSEEPIANARTLNDQIQAFNAALADAGLGQADLHHRFTLLNAVEQSANQWLRDHNTTASETDRTAIFGLLREVETEHERLVDQQIRGGHDLWVKEGTSEEDAQQMRQLWQSISTKSGNIQIDRTDADHAVTVQAGIAKLLQTEHGRTMLGELDEAQDDEADQIHIGRDWRGAWDDHPEADAWQGGSWAFPSASLQTPGDRSHETGGTGTGSHVQVDYGAEPHPVVGPGGKPVPMPGFITLGHELGHALHNLRGTSRPVGWDGADDPTTQFEQAMWTNSEEHQNITQNENPLRRQSGLPERTYHKPPEMVAMRRRYDALMKRLNEAEEKVPESKQALVDRAHNFRPELATPTTELLDEFEERVKAVENAVPWTNLKRAGVGALLLGGSLLTAYLAKRLIG